MGKNPAHRPSVLREPSSGSDRESSQNVVNKPTSDALSGNCHASQVIVVGGGPAGFFAAIACAEAGASVILLEQNPSFLSKVRMSGGGHGNVTHTCLGSQPLSARFPRGEQELFESFQCFSVAETVFWFETRGVRLLTEPDGRVSPATGDSQTIMDCLLNSARQAGVDLRANSWVQQVVRKAAGGFQLLLGGGEKLECDRLLLATGANRAEESRRLAVSLGHTLTSPVLSLFNFQVASTWLHELAGLRIDNVVASIPPVDLSASGSLEVTRWGLSGPVILELSAWGARPLRELNYIFPLHINWLPQVSRNSILAMFQTRTKIQGNTAISAQPPPGLSEPLWKALVGANGIKPDAPWSSITLEQLTNLARQLTDSELFVVGHYANKGEFVTCGGVRLDEVDFHTMESRVCPGLYFAGEILDVDGAAGGFNMQAAWTTGWIAGQHLAVPGAGPIYAPTESRPYLMETCSG